VPAGEEGYILGDQRAVRAYRDGDDVILEIASATPGKIRLSITELTVLIRELGLLRAQLSTNLPSDLTGARVDTVFDPRWLIQPDTLNEGSILAFYHPAFGPIGFSIPKDQVSNILRVLSRHQTIQPSSGKKPN
jgi:hypothetical protein